MKNMKVSLKLILCFLIVVALAVAVALIGIYGMHSINKADDDLYNYNVIALDALGSIRENFATQRATYRGFIMYNSESDQFKDALQTLSNLESEMEEYIAVYIPTMTEDEDKRLFNEFIDIYSRDYKDMKAELIELGMQNDTETSLRIIDTTAKAIADTVNSALHQCYTFNVNDAKEAVNSNTDLYKSMTVVEAVALAIAVAISLILAFYLSGLISKPLALMTAFLNKAGSTGDLTLSQADVENIGKFSKAKDEIGQCISSCAQFVTRLLDVSKSLETVASGDLTTELDLLSDNDTMGISLQKMTVNLNNMFSEINASTAQVSTGSHQIADGAQALAQGSAEQASTVEELSASFSEIAEKTNQNAGMANEAASLSNAIKSNAEMGSEQMDNLMKAVEEINEASGSISKVIKVIDDIAFQTNILALNAAVEAARAGQHGKGFAVVAEEVRNLAAKSAEAAKDTGGLIENSIEKANLGLDIANKTSESLRDIVDGINRSAEIVAQIALASDEQSMAIAQISTGIDQVSQVVQQNSATAEESAAASEEMNGQANMLQRLIAQFKLKNQGR